MVGTLQADSAMHKDRLKGAHVHSLCPPCMKQSLGQVCRPFERRRFHTDHSRGGREARGGCGGPATPALRVSKKWEGGCLVETVSQTGSVFQVATARALITCRLPSLAPKDCGGVGSCSGSLPDITCSVETLTPLNSALLTFHTSQRCASGHSHVGEHLPPHGSRSTGPSAFSKRPA